MSAMICKRFSYRIDTLKKTLKIVLKLSLALYLLIPSAAYFDFTRDSEPSYLTCQIQTL